MGSGENMRPSAGSVTLTLALLREERAFNVKEVKALFRHEIRPGESYFVWYSVLRPVLLTCKKGIK